MRTGEGVKNSENFADIISRSSLRRAAAAEKNPITAKKKREIRHGSIFLLLPPPPGKGQSNSPSLSSPLYPSGVVHTPREFFSTTRNCTQ